ncbi:MAG: sulfatase [Planctomycetota bacterium]
MRRIALLLLLGFCLAPFPALAQAEEAKQPNILFFFTDDQRSDTLGCYGHPIVKTPTIDGLAKRGVRFENMFVSHSICWVSRTTILSGLTARSFGKKEAPDSAKTEAVEQLYSDLLREAGYRTGFVGKWHAKMPGGYKPESHFDVFQKIFRRPYLKPQPDGSLRHETELICDAGIEFLKSQPRNKPFALNLWFNASHAEDGDKRPGIGHFPWPQAVEGMYEDIEIPAPRLSDPSIYESQPEFLKKSINRERFFWRWDTPEKYQTNIRAYFRMLSGIDTAMARVLKVLEDEGLADNTIILYSADNGYYMGDRGFAGKWSHYEQSLRVPLIILDPRNQDSRQGAVAAEKVLNLDFAPTFLDWAGVDVPERYQGHSLAALVSGVENPDWRQDTFHEHVTLRPNIGWEGIRDDDFKYARYFDQNPVFEFFHDLRNDPDELVNLAKNPKYQEQLKRYRQRCEAYVDRYGGPLTPYDPAKDPRRKRKQSK